MFKIIITDELSFKHQFNVNSVNEVSKIITEWLSSIDETPIYEIIIEII